MEEGSQTVQSIAVKLSVKPISKL